MNLSKGINRVTKSTCNIFTSSVAAFLLLFSSSVLSEDIELYISETIKQTQNRPKVLIVFDTSGSMGWTEKFKPAYISNPDAGDEYDALDGLTKESEDYIYYSKGDSASQKPTPDSPTETRRFLDAINGCQTARTILNEVGYYTGRIREYTFQGNSGRWTEIPENSGESIKVIDCEDDVLTANGLNAQIKNSSGAITTLPSPQVGFPIDAEGTKDAPQYHTAVATDSNISWTGPLVTLYTAAYLRWQQNDSIPKVDRTRMSVAKESVKNLIYSTPNVDFGMQVFNRNNSSDTNGGRIVHGIQESTATSRKVLLDLVEDEVTARGNTPLCETLYEASRYFSGKSVDFGDNGGSLIPSRDLTVESSGVYKTPFSSCSDKVYVVLITDGVPTSDTGADSKVKALPVSGQDSITTSDRFDSSYLPALAGWMNNNDLNTNIDGKQTASTYTVGFSAGAVAAESLLQETATRGGGQYFFATDSASLTTALTNVLADLEPSNDTLTSASVASNNFDHTQTLDSVYYAMFQPDRGPRWQGNLKKYKVIGGVQKGSNDVEAIKSSTGHFSDEVQSYWSSTKDGDSVQEGGVAEMLRKKRDRVIYSDLGDSNGLVKLTYDEAFGTSTIFDTRAKLAEKLDVANDETVIKNMLSWIQGNDIDDADEDGVFAENRPDVFGDPLHSTPVVINYGNDKIYIVVGTNHGLLHMFKDDDVNNTVDETWAFMPNDFISNIKALRDNFTSADKVYGLDGKITKHVVDHNGNGIVDGDDKVWLFFGFRRGGNAYYAMDVTTPESPSIKWIIKGGAGDFKELGQTWSQPKVAYSKLNASDTEAKPVLIFGGGYTTSKDSHAIGGAGGNPDNLGKAIYMVDADTGILKWSLSSNGDTAFNGTDSIPSSIATLDSDGDGLTDRLYAGDTGGNVWRIDMPGSVKSEFSVFKLASLGGDVSNSVDRRFFNEPAIARTYISETIDTGKKDAEGKAIIVKQNIPYDAILIGSGDGTNPIGTDTQDVLFMIKDTNIRTHQFTIGSTPAIPSVIVMADLYDYTDNPFLTPTEKKYLDASSASGWFMDLEELGEKTTAEALVIRNVVYFTTYIPPVLGVLSVSCDLPNGQGWLYAVDLALGIKKFNWETEDEDTDDIRKIFISEQFLGPPTLIVTEDPETEELKGVGVIGRTPLDMDVVPRTIRNYLYVTEN